MDLEDMKEAWKSLTPQMMIYKWRRIYTLGYIGVKPFRKKLEPVFNWIEEMEERYGEGGDG